MAAGLSLQSFLHLVLVAQMKMLPQALLDPQPAKFPWASKAF